MNKQNSNRVDAKVFSMAANLFGIQGPKEQIVSLPQIIKAFPERIVAVYPAIIQDAFAGVMDNYRLYVAAYNFKTTAENEQLAKYNKAVLKFRAETALTEVQQQFSKEFEKKYRDLSNRQWNEQAESFNLEYGMLILKKKVQTIKPSSELVFQNMLYVYNTQLMKRNEQYMRLRLTSPQPIQAFKVNPHQIVELRRNGVLSIDLCKRTIRNHKERLIEAGVFFDYHFKGANRPVEMHINPEILAVLDIKTGKIVVAENQRVSPAKVKELPYNNVNTRTVINECEIKENVKTHSRDKEFPSVTPFSFVFYKNTTGKDDIFPPGPPPEGVKFFEKMPQLAGNGPRTAGTHSAQQLVKSALSVPPDTGCSGSATKQTLSDKLSALIIHPQDLAEQLSNKMFLSYVPIDRRVLEKEAFRGTLTNEEFRQLVLQDFFKSAQKLWPVATPFVGSWKKAINLYYESKFISFTNLAFNKSVILDDIEQLRWRLEYSRKYSLKHPEFQLLFPNQYFDFTRTEAKEGGFEYTKKAWQKHQKYLKTAEERKKNAEKCAQLRKSRINYAKKCEMQIKRFFRNQISMPELLDYVHNNLPQQYQDKLPEMIQKISSNFKK